MLAKNKLSVSEIKICRALCTAKQANVKFSVNFPFNHFLYYLPLNRLAFRGNVRNDTVVIK